MEQKYVLEVIEAIVLQGAIKAVKYVGEKEIIRATRKRFGKRVSKRDNIEIFLTIGRPNFRERLFIKAAKKAGEPLPIKKVQLKWDKPR